MATDMVSMAFLGHYDIAFLVSGDGDLAPAVEAVKAAGKQTVCCGVSTKSLGRRCERG